MEPLREEPEPLPPRRWRLLLGIAVLAVAALMVFAATQFPPRPTTGGGSPPCPTCYSFSVVAGIGGTLTFNGTVPGPTMTVPLDAHVSVRLIVDPAATDPHSWMLVPLNGTSSSVVVFPGANTTNPSVGLTAGASQTISFVADAAGTYKYICGVDTHYVYMWGHFNVTA